jgi:hypothetical protein
MHVAGDGLAIWDVPCHYLCVILLVLPHQCRSLAAVCCRVFLPYLLNSPFQMCLAALQELGNHALQPRTRSTASVPTTRSSSPLTTMAAHQITPPRLDSLACSQTPPTTHTSQHARLALPPGTTVASSTDCNLASLSVALPTSEACNIRHAVEDMKVNLDSASERVKETTASAVVGSIKQLTAAIRSSREQVQDLHSVVRRDGLCRMLSLRSGRRRTVPWLWSAQPGASATVQYGMSARLPVNAACVAQHLTSAESSAESMAVGSQRKGTQGKVLTPVFGSLHMQPIMRARAEVTVGKFRRWMFDHTSIAAELEAGLRHASAMGLREFGPRAAERSGIAHLATLYVKQQLFGPLRACADVRWELSADGGREGVHPPDSRSRPPAFARAAVCHVVHLRPQFTDSVVGLDWSFGAARVAAWYSPLRKQGLLEFQL